MSAGTELDQNRSEHVVAIQRDRTDIKKENNDCCAANDSGISYNIFDSEYNEKWGVDASNRLKWSDTTTVFCLQKKKKLTSEFAKIKNKRGHV